MYSSFCRAPGGTRFLRVQVQNPPGSGKDIAEGKVIYREMESEGSRMLGTYYPQANLWSDEQKLHQAIYGDKVATQEIEMKNGKKETLNHVFHRLFPIKP